MSIDNSTGKTKGFYERGQAMFDRIPKGEKMTLAWYDPTNQQKGAKK